MTRRARVTTVARRNVGDSFAGHLEIVAVEQAEQAERHAQVPLRDSVVIHSPGIERQFQAPDARLEVIEGTAHLPSIERPEAFNPLLASFLEQL